MPVTLSHTKSIRILIMFFITPKFRANMKNFAHYHNVSDKSRFERLSETTRLSDASKNFEGEKVANINPSPESFYSDFR